MIVGCWLLVALPGFRGLLIGQLAVGVSQLLMIISAQTSVSYLGSGPKLEKYYGWYTTFLSFGQMLGPLLSGWIIDYYGGPESAIYTAFLLSFIALASLFASSDKSHEKLTQKDISRRQRLQGLVKEQLAIISHNNGVKRSLIVSLAAMLALGAHSSFFPVYLESLALSGTMIGVLISLRALASMAIRPLTSQVVRLFHGRYATMSMTMALMASGLVLVGHTADFYLLCLFSVLVGVGIGLSQPLSMVVIVESVLEKQRAHALAMRLMVNRGMQFMAPLLMGVIAEFTGFTWAYLICGVVIFLHMAAFMRLVRR